MSTLSIATAAEVFDLLRDDLAAIEQEFSRQSASNVEVVTDIARYLIAGGGKRIRPLLLLLSAKALGCTSESRIRLGAVVEMLHTATLVHDDIIDEADTRRGRPSSNTTWGNAKCVLAGERQLNGGKVVAQKIEDLGCRRDGEGTHSSFRVSGCRFGYRFPAKIPKKC